MGNVNALQRKRTLDTGSAGDLLQQRTNRWGGNETGSLEDLKATAETSDDLARIAQDADGNYYRPEYTANDTLLNTLGMGHLSNASSGRAPTARIFSKANAQQMGHLGKEGVVFGSMWNSVDDLNRGRRSTGFGQPHVPGAEMIGAGQRGADMQERLNSSFVNPNRPLAIAGAENDLELTQQMEQPGFGTNPIDAPAPARPTRRNALVRQYSGTR